MSGNKLSYAAASQSKTPAIAPKETAPPAVVEKKETPAPPVKKAWQGANPILKSTGNVTGNVPESVTKFGNVPAPDLARTASAPSALPKKNVPAFANGYTPRPPANRPPYMQGPVPGYENGQFNQMVPNYYTSPTLSAGTPEKGNMGYRPPYQQQQPYYAYPDYLPNYPQFGQPPYYNPNQFNGGPPPPSTPSKPVFQLAGSKPRTPIKIVNPNSKEEVKLPVNVKPIPAPPPAALVVPVVAKPVDQVQETPKPKKAIVLTNPETGETKVIASKVVEKSPERSKSPEKKSPEKSPVKAEKSPVKGEPEWPTLPTPAAAAKPPKAPLEKAKSPVLEKAPVVVEKVVEKPKVVLASKPVVAPVVTQEPVAEKEVSPVAKSPELEEGEIDEELFLPDDVRLLTPEEFATIQYPEGVVAPVVADNGQIRYSMDFMLAFQEAVLYKPKGIPPFSKIYIEGDYKRNVNMSRQPSDRSRGGRGGGRPSRNDRTSMSRQNSNSSRGHNMPGRRNRNGPPAPLIVKSENAWDAKKMVQTENDAILKVYKGILNKLTLDTFDKLTDKIVALNIDNEELLFEMIHFLFQKAIDELHFSAMYAKLCRQLINRLPVGREWMGDHGNTSTNLVRRILLKKCQEEFENDAKWTADEEAHADERAALRKILDSLSPEEKAKIAEEEYERSKLKRRVLGNIRFVGELFLQDLISEKIIHSCIQSLLRKTEEEDVESLCKLLTSVGKRLDHSKGQDIMKSYFEQVKGLSVNTNLSSRVRFTLMDLIDLRKDNWVPRATGPVTAKSTAQVRKEIEQEERNKQAAKSSGGNRNQPTRQQQGQNRREKRPATVTEGDGWTSVSARAEPKQVSKPSASVASVRSVWGGGKKTETVEIQKTVNSFGALELETTPVADTPEVVEEPVKNQEAIVIDAIKNYKESFEVREVLDDIKDVDDPEMIQKLVSLVVQFLVDTNGKNALRVVSLLKALFYSETAVYDSASVIQGFHKFFTSGFEDDMSDFPKAFVNIGQVLVPLLNESLITFNDVFEISEPLKDFAGMKPPRGMFIKDILTVVEQEGGSVIRFMIANQVDIKAFFKPGTKDDVPKKWLFRTSNDLPKVVLLNEITNRIYALAGAEPKSYRWFHATEDQDVLNRDDFDSLVSRAVLDYLGDTVIFKEQGEASPEIYDSLETQLSLLQPVLEIVNPLVLLTTTQEFCTEKQILGITCLLDVYLGDILFRLFHNFNLVTTETFLEYKSSCSPEIAKKLSGWFKHLQAIQ